jgi:hypothetical protein
MHSANTFNAAEPISQGRVSDLRLERLERHKIVLPRSYGKYESAPFEKKMLRGCAGAGVEAERGYPHCK